MTGSARQSLINRTAITLSAVMLIAIINMLVTFLIAESAENDAVRINLSGSLRMQSYRMVEALLIQDDTLLNPGEEDLLQTRIGEFEERLARPVLSGYFQRKGHPELNKSFTELETAWELLKTQLTGNARASIALLAQVDEFVMSVDELVGRLELKTENKFKQLRLFQSISLLVTIAIVVFAYVEISTNVVAPLKRLLVMAEKVRAGDFSQRLKAKGNDELSLLSGTFDEMSASLDDMYSELEIKVQEKTLHLEQAKDGLALLYDTSRLLSTGGNIVERIERSLLKISQYFPGISTQVDLTQDSKTPFRLMAPGHTARPQCKHQYRIMIDRESQTYGELLISSDQPFTDEQWSLLQTIADNMAAAINADWQHDQQRRLVLMEERAVIARELHDSLAQSLSYLKIQISRMQMLKRRGDDSGELENTVQHIKTGIDAAYGQLRELLATFRLQLSNDGLQSDLENTVAEFAERGAISIELEYGISNFPLTPHEEIHILQIVREALSNVVRHTKTSSAKVTLRATQQRSIEVCISDDGCGFNQLDKGSGHYGKTIMQERARTLAGEVTFANQPGGGAIVSLTFAPDVARTNCDEVSQL